MGAFQRDGPGPGGFMGTFTFLCESRQDSPEHYNLPVALLRQQGEEVGGIAMLTLTGYPFAQHMRQGRQYEITVREVVEELQQ